MGFPSPAKDYLEKDIDIASYLIAHPLATYFLRVQGNGMTGAHIPDNSLLIIDRSLMPNHNMIVVVDLNGERLVRRLIKTPRSWVLQADGMGIKPVVITKDMDLQIFGVVSKIIIEP